MQVSVVLTIYNERDTIDQFIERSVASFTKANLSYELIFVDDRSQDGTRERILYHQQNNPAIKYLGMSRRFGRQECFFAGFKEAKGDFVVILDCDLQDPPELIPELYQRAIEEEADVVYTVMTERPGEGKMKLLLIEAGYYLLKKLCPIPIERHSGTFKMVNRRVADTINQIEEVDSFFKTLITWVGHKQIAYPFKRLGRPAGDSHYPMYGRRAYRDFLAQITGFSYRPLYALIFISTLIFLVCSLLFIFSLIINGPFSFVRDLISSPLAVLGLMGFSIIFFAQGIIAAYLIQIHASTRGRPRYVVSERKGFE